jgi:hypothetical protein
LHSWELKYGKYIGIAIMLGLFINTLIVAQEAYKGQSEQSNQLNKTFDLLRGKRRKICHLPGLGEFISESLG